MTQQAGRSVDFLDLLVNVQQGNESTAPASSPYMLNVPEPDLIKSTDTTLTGASTGGPPYYPGDTLICGLWSCG